MNVIPIRVSQAWRKRNASALQMLMQQNNKDALRYLREAVRKTHDFRALNNLGFFYLTDADEVLPRKCVSPNCRARRLLTLALVISPAPNAVMMENLGQMYFANKMYECAAKAFHTADSLAPSAVLRYNEGVCRFLGGQKQQASQCFRFSKPFEAQIIACGGDNPGISEAFSSTDEIRASAARDYLITHPNEVSPDMVALMLSCGLYTEILEQFEVLAANWVLGEHELAVLAECCLKQKRRFLEKRDLFVQILGRGVNQLFYYMYCSEARKEAIDSYHYIPPIAKRCGYFNCPLHFDDQRLSS